MQTIASVNYRIIIFLSRKYVVFGQGVYSAIFNDSDFVEIFMYSMLAIGVNSMSNYALDAYVAIYIMYTYICIS